MKTKTVFVLVAAIALCAPAAAQAGTVPVQSLSGGFAATNSTVTKTPDGVHFGTYADGGALGGTLIYTGLNGSPLSALADFSYTFTYRQAGSTTGAAPYARVFLDADGDGVADDDVILDPSFCASVTPDQSTDLTFQMVGNSVRFDDDGCDGVTPDQQPFAAVVAAHGGETIVGLLVSQGNSTGVDVSALLRQITVNGTTFAFNVPAPAGAPGVTTIVNVPAPAAARPTGGAVLGTQASSCKGDDRLTLHAVRRAHLLSVRASLRGKALNVNGRSIVLDLRNRTEGNYDVKITERFRSGGRIRTSATHRVRSVACA